MPKAIGIIIIIGIIAGVGYVGAKGAIGSIERGQDRVESRINDY